MALSRRRFSIGAAVAGSSFVLGRSRALAADAPKIIQVGTINATSDAGAFLAQEFGYFRDEGLEVQFRTIASAPEIVAAVATSQIQVGGLSITPGLFAAVDQGINLRIVGDKQSFSPGFGSNKLIVRKAAVKASEKETVEAWRGKTIAVNSRGAITFYLMANLLQKYGVSLAEVKLIELSYSNIAVTLSKGMIEAGSLIEPFVTQSLKSGDTAIIGGELLEFVLGGRMSVTPLIYSEDFRQKKPVAEAFMRSYMRGVRAYNDAFVKGIRKDEVIAIIAKRTNVSEDIVRDGFLPGLDPNQRVNVEALNAVENFFASQGSVRHVIDAGNIVDMSYADAAVAALGPYK
jgi:NitT/TauT family transport system substrate-binding protein